MKRNLKIYKLKPIMVLDGKTIDMEDLTPFLVLDQFKVGDYEFVTGYPINFDWEFAGAGVPVFDEDDSNIPLTFLVEVWNRRILPKEFLEGEIGEVSKTLFTKKMKIVKYLETEHFPDIIEFRKNTSTRWDKLDSQLSVKYKILEELVLVDIILKKLLSNIEDRKNRYFFDMAAFLLNDGVVPVFRGEDEEVRFWLMKVREILIHKIRNRMRRKNVKTDDLKILISVIDSLLYDESGINIDRKSYKEIAAILEDIRKDPETAYKKIKKIINRFAGSFS